MDEKRFSWLVFIKLAIARPIQFTIYDIRLSVLFFILSALVYTYTPTYLYGRKDSLHEDIATKKWVPSMCLQIFR